MNASARDFAFMARALQLAGRGLYSAQPNPRVGCVIVAGDAVVAEGWHQRTGGPHAEAVALAAAAGQARGATAYVTLEPCCHQGRTPPCTAALVAAGIARVVYAADDANPRVAGQGAAALRAAGIDVLPGVMAAESRALNRGFFSRMEHQRPWLRAKLAASLDGRTALASGASRWISGEPARRDAHELRARSSAILTGIGTVLADDPALTVRRPDLGEAVPPERVVLDSSLRTPPQAQLLRQPGTSRIFCSRPDAARAAALRAAGAQVETLAGSDGRPDLALVLRRLAELEANEVLVEAGPGLNGALLDAGLIDELVVYLAPLVLGADSRGMFASRPLATMAERHEFVLAGTRQVGDDLRLSFLKRSP